MLELSPSAAGAGMASARTALVMRRKNFMLKFSLEKFEMKED